VKPRTSSAPAHTQTRRHDARFVKIALTLGAILIALAAAIGAAAAIAVSGNDLGAGDDVVVGCDSAVVVGWNTGFENSGVNGPGYYVNQVKLQGVHDDCVGQFAKVTITRNGNSLFEVSGVINQTVPDPTFGLPAGVVPSAWVDDVHVEIRDDDYEGGEGGQGGQGGPGGGGQGGEGGEGGGGGPSCTTHPEHPHCDPNKEGGQGGEDGEGGPGGGPSCTTHPEHPHCDPNK
jgi:uncharacterized membrane protein YgcG